jgi:Cu-Zn family superoxide dismutase
MLRALACAIVILLVATGGALAQVPTLGATAEVRDASGRVVANAEFREGRGEVLITILLPNPPVLSGTHAVHINDTGRCDPPAFTSSGNIFNPFNKKHGRQNPEGSEVGDLPNVNFTTGLTSYNTTAVGATLGSGPGSLLTPARALVIFAGEDDQKTDPEGGAGMRIGCGLISAPSGATAAQAGLSTSTPSPTPATAPAVPKIASPVPAAQPGQPAAGQPVPKPASSPVVVPPPAVVKPATSPSAVAAGQPIPTPIVAPTPVPVGAVAPAPQSGGGLNGLTALIIAVLGVGLVGAGYLLRRRSELQRKGN